MNVTAGMATGFWTSTYFTTGGGGGGGFGTTTPAAHGHPNRGTCQTSSSAHARALTLYQKQGVGIKGTCQDFHGPPPSISTRRRSRDNHQQRAAFKLFTTSRFPNQVGMIPSGFNAWWFSHAWINNLGPASEQLVRLENDESRQT